MATPVNESSFVTGEVAPALFGNVQLSRVRFDIVIVHDWADIPEVLYAREYNGCQLFKDANKQEEGTDPETVEVDINPLEIIEIINGVRTVLL